jgi:MoxR-like ATPase
LNRRTPEQVVAEIVQRTPVPDPYGSPSPGGARGL